MIIDCIADLHGYYPKLDGGDLLIVAGDLTANDSIQGYDKFFDWLALQNYTKKIYISGNHDNMIFNNKRSTPKFCDATYLCDSGTEFEGLKIWGSPWTKRFDGMNPKCMAFTVDTDEELAEKWKSIPKNIDILITHSPSQGVLDETVRCENVGSESLIKPMINSGCRLHVFGHIHEAYGKFYNPILGITYVNASHVSERYEPVNKPVRVILFSRIILNL
jgi:Icc-related predicted phosphoesterase